MYFIIMDVMKIYNINSLSITRISIFVGNRFGGSFKTWDGTRHYFFSSFGEVPHFGFNMLYLIEES